MSIDDRMVLYAPLTNRETIKRLNRDGILKRVCCHSFRATGVTEYMNSGGTIEIAQRIAGHTSPATTRIYDRSGDRLTLEEIERVQIGKKQVI
jgi:integrase